MTQPAPAYTPIYSRWFRPVQLPITVRNQGTAAGGAVVFLAVMFAADIATGPNIHFGFLYLYPVLVAAWFGGRWPGYFLGVLATAAWLYVSIVELERHEGALATTVNIAIRLVYYTVVVELVRLAQNNERRLQAAIRERTTQLETEVAERERIEQSLHGLAAQLSAAEETERRRVAYDIHDALGQMLGVVKMNLETVVAETAIDTRQYARLSDVVKVVDGLIHQTQDLVFDLHPSMLDHFGLGPTLERFAEEYHRRTLAEVSITEIGEKQSLPSSLTGYLYRAVKEVVNNAVKHGNAREVIVGLHWAAAELRIVIDDDGAGFDTSVALRPRVGRGLGLAGINKRMMNLGGSMWMESQPGHGARIVLSVPTKLD